VSGVGGQYNFVTMAHALPEARSILCLRATRTSGGKTTSNIVWNYGHTTIARHLRDLVVTEYGVADLRGRTDREIVEALIGVMDARFQEGLVREAQRAHKLPRGYRIPDAARANDPRALDARFAPWRERGLFAELPFGSDFTPEEIVLARTLRSIRADADSWSGRIRLALHALRAGRATPDVQPYLARMGLENARSISEMAQRRVLAAALKQQA
jgi:hypothetical protein